MKATSQLRRVGRGLALVALALALACSGRDEAGGPDSLSGGGGVLRGDAGGLDTLPNGAHGELFGASMELPHVCGAAPAVAGAFAFVAPKLRCRELGDVITATRTLPANAAIPQGTDEAAVRAAIDAAGEGGTVAFEGGTTYDLCGSLRPRKGQRWTRTGTGQATLRRCDGLNTTLTTAVQAGATTLAVPAGAGFPVGAELTVVVAAEVGAKQTPTSGCPLSHRVVAATATTRTITPPLTRAFAAGDKVISAFAQVDVRVPSVQIDALVFDGNASGNPDFSAAETFQSIHIRDADGVVVRNNVLRDSPADAIGVDGCASCRVLDNQITRAKGAGVRLGRSTAALLRGNRLTHVERGGLRWAGDNVAPWLHQNCVSDTAGVAMGRLGAGDRDVRIEGNALVRVGGVLTVPSAADLDAPATRRAGGDVLLGLTVRDNYGVAVGALHIGAPADAKSPPIVAATSPRLIGITVTGNQWLGGRIDISGGRDIVVQHNTCASATLAAAPAVDAMGPPRLTPAASDGLGAATLTLRGVQQLDVHNNLLLGGGRSLRLEQRAPGGVGGVTIRNNTLLQADKTGLSVGDGAAMNAEPPAPGAPISGVTLRNNTVVASLPQGGATPWAGWLGHGTHLLGNCVESPNGLLLESVAPGTETTNAAPTVLFRNDVRPTETSIGAVGSGGGLYVRNNWLLGPIAPAILKSKISTVSGNFGNDIPCNPCWPGADLWLTLPAGAPVEVAP